MTRLKSCQRPFAWLALLGVLGSAAATESHAQPDTEKQPADTEKQPSVATFDGVFEAVEMSEITADTEQVTSLEIKKIVPHGTTIRKGQNLVWFDTEELDEQVSKAESELRLAELAFDDQEFAYQQFLESQKLDRESAERNFEKAKQDYDNFVRVDRERRIETAEYTLKNAQASLDNVKEELEQLQQMYEEDDLTEASEEIVLKRAKQAVENAEYRLRGAEITHHRAIEQNLPRETAEQEANFAKARLNRDKAIRDLDSALKKRDLERKQQQEDIERQREDFEELRRERQKSVLTAPHDGVVLYGELNRGKLADKPSGLEAGSEVSSDQVIVTLANPERLQVRIDLPEKDLPLVAKGTRATVRPVAYPQQELVGTVKSVSQVPFAGTKYDCLVSIKVSGDGPAIVPGMTCQVEVAKPDTEESATTGKDDDESQANAETDDNESNSNDESDTESDEESDVESDREAEDREESSEK